MTISFELRRSGQHHRPRSVERHMPTKPPFQVVVERHGPTVLRVCRAVVGEDDADDAWSETFLSAMKAYPSLPDDANLEAWLVTIAHRRAIDVGRARTRRAVPTATIVDRPHHDGVAATDPDLVAALASLPDKQRQSVAYHYLAGLPYAEIASIVGGTAAAARRAAADGIAALRRSGAVTNPHHTHHTGRKSR
jgi:RNA polymerase sigma factor (sigma-70 family)